MRNNNLDNARGAAIILVIIGHSIQYCMEGGEYVYNTAFRTIYSFHMPLFFMISGYVNGYSTTNVTIRKYLSKVKVLLIPFVVWGIVSSVYHQNSISQFFNALLHAYPYWFLWSTFMFLTILYSARKIEEVTKYKYTAIVVMCLVLVISKFTASPLFGLNFIPHLLPYFILGYTLCRYNILEFNFINMKPRTKSTIKIIVIMCFIALFVIFSRYYSLDKQVITTPFFSISNSYLVYGYDFIIAIGGIITTFWLLSRNTIKFISNFIGHHLGNITLEIYVMHYYIIFVLNTYLTSVNVNLSLRIIICTISALGLSYIITKFINKIRPLRLVLFGNY